MGIGEFVRLKCLPQTLHDLAAGLTSFGPASGEPEWLTSGVWLWTGQAQYIATASVEVRPNGYVGRTLCIGTPDDLAHDLQAQLPDISNRLLAGGNGMELPPPFPPSPPQSPTSWMPGSYDTHVLVRVSQRASNDRTACGLLFSGAKGRSLLVGTDVSTLAMVLSEDPELIDRYRKDCDALSPDEYLALARS